MQTIRPTSVTIYGLRDPRDGLIYYVGKSKRMMQRYNQHIYRRSTNADKQAWIDGLRVAGLHPKIEVLEESDESDWQEAEQFWIAHGRELGWPLTNRTRGGEGGNGQAVFSFFDGYLEGQDQESFDAMSVTKRWQICQGTAMAMAAVHSDFLRRKMKAGQYAMWPIINDVLTEIGTAEARRLLNT